MVGCSCYTARISNKVDRGNNRRRGERSKALDKRRKRQPHRRLLQHQPGQCESRTYSFVSDWVPTIDLNLLHFNAEPFSHTLENNFHGVDDPQLGISLTI